MFLKHFKISPTVLLRRGFYKDNTRCPSIAFFFVSISHLVLNFTKKGKGKRPKFSTIFLHLTSLFAALDFWVENNLGRIIRQFK